MMEDGEASGSGLKVNLFIIYMRFINSFFSKCWKSECLNLYTFDLGGGSVILDWEIFRLKCKDSYNVDAYFV